MIAFGTLAPHCALLEPATGDTVGLDDLAGPAMVVTFICNHCPYVKHVAAGLAALGRDLAEQGVAMVAISSNDVVTYPQDGPDQMAVAARDYGWTFPYLYDETQDVARAFSAAARPTRSSSTVSVGSCIAASWITPDRATICRSRLQHPRGSRRCARRAAGRCRPTTVDGVRHQVALTPAHLTRYAGQ